MDGTGLSKCERDIVATIAARRLAEHQKHPGTSRNRWGQVYSSPSISYLTKGSYIIRLALERYRQGDSVIINSDGTLRPMT
jgi:hypothetical protein